MLPRIQAALAELDRELEDGLISYLNFLIAGRNLRQSEEVLSYQHPRVELGLEQAMLAHANVSSRMLGYLVKALVDLDEGANNDWGTESAANLLGAIYAQEQLTPTIPPEVRQRIDRWLDDRVASTGPDFEDDLKLAAIVGSSESTVAELARWLTHRNPKREWHSFDDWEPPERSQEWYQRISSDSRTEAICAAFITRSLPRVHARFGRDFPDAIARLSPNLTPAFLEATRHILVSGYHPNDDAIFAGALRDIPAVEAVVGEAVAYLGKPRTDEERKLHLALLNGEYDQLAAEHYYEDAGEEGYSAREFLEAYVDLRRTSEGWEAIANHPSAAGLVEAWFKVLRNKAATNDAEWDAIAGLSSGWEEAVLWERLRNTVPSGLLGRLEERLVKGDERIDVRLESIRAAIVSAPSSIGRAVDTLVKEGNIARVLELALDIETSPDHDFKVDTGAALDDVRAHADAPLRELISAFLSDHPPSLSTDALALVRSLVDSKHRSVLLRSAKLLASGGEDAKALLRGVLANQSDYTDEAISDSATAIEIADSAGYLDVVAEGLPHPFAAVNLRFHPHCYYRPDAASVFETWPAMIAAVTDLDGTITGVHRTWLSPDGTGKAPIDTPRRAIGHLLGNAVRFELAGEVT